jgi:hypothetical protein
MKRIGLLVIALGLMFITYNNAFACVCMVQPNNEKDLKKAIIHNFNYSSLVFSGKVIGAESVPAIIKNHLGKEVKAENLVYRLSVEKLYKGEAESEVILYTDVFKYGDTSQTTSCDFNFKIGEQYFVYASPNQEGKLQRRGCSRTDLIKNAKMDIKEIQKLTNKMKH